jgi:hypothetical protein
MTEDVVYINGGMEVRLIFESKCMEVWRLEMGGVEAYINGGMEARLIEMNAKLILEYL